MKLVPGGFMKVCRDIADVVKIGQTYREFYLKV